MSNVFAEMEELLNRLNSLLDTPSLTTLAPDKQKILNQQLAQAQRKLAPSENFGSHQDELFRLGLAICNSLPASMVFVDQEGVITWVNQEWETTAGVSNFSLQNGGVGANYLEVCNRSAPYDAEAATAFTEISNLLQGKVTHCSFEYACHTPNQKRWFRMMGAAVQSGKTKGAVLIHMDITARVLAQRALVEAERRYRDIFENAIEGIFRSTLDGRYLSANPALAHILEFDSPEELIREVHNIGKDLYLEPEKREEFLNHLNTSGYVYNFEIQVRTKKGNVRWIRTNARLVKDDYGADAYIQGSNFDITAEKGAEARLEAEHNLLRTLLDHLPDYVYVKDSQGRYLLNNLANLKLLGAKSNTELFGKTVFDLFPQSIAEGYHTDDLKVIKHGEKLLDKEELIQSGEGKTSWISTTKVPLRDSSGKTLGLVGISRDITQRKKHELEIQKLAAFPRYNPNPVFSFNLRGDLLYCNEAAHHLASALNLSDPSRLLPPHYQVLVGECLRHSNDSLRLETELRKKALSWAFFPIREISEVHCYAMDVTERRMLEEQVRHSQKMESIGQLAGGVAHDFNNILTIIQGNASFMAAMDNFPAELSFAVKEILAAAERAANLTRQLLMFSRKQAIQPAILDLGEVVATHTKLLRRMLSEDITLDLSIAPNLPMVKADRTMLEQVIMNLVVNARDAMPKGGAVKIAINQETVLTSEQPDFNGPYVTVEVKDTGVGIPPDILPRIFEPFFTTKEVGKGTGLGLATAYGIVKQHHGHIRVASTVGEGSTFMVYLPAFHAEKLELQAHQAREVVRGGTESILLVEDEPALRSLIAQVLRNQGYQVVEAASGPKALQVWESHKGFFQLLLTDFVMPDGMTGGDLMVHLKGLKPDLKVVFITGYSPDIANFSLPSDSTYLLQKPFKPKTLAKMVRSALDGERPPQ